MSVKYTNHNNNNDDTSNNYNIFGSFYNTCMISAIFNAYKAELKLCFLLSYARMYGKLQKNSGKFCKLLN